MSSPFLATHRVTGTNDRLQSTVIFDRHPASIDHYGHPSPVTPAGFDGIRTWSPLMLADDAPEAVPEARSPPPVPVPAVAPRREPPPGYLPPPVPVQLAAEPRPLPDPPVAEPQPDPPVAEPQPEPPTPSVADGPAGAPPTAELDDIGPVPLSVPLPMPEAADISEPAVDSALVTPDSAPVMRPSAPDDPAGVALWDGDTVPASVSRRARRRVRTPTSRSALPRLAVGSAVAAVLVIVVAATIRYLPAMLNPGQTVVAVFNAPMMVVRSAAAGRVVTVAAAASQVVEPTSPLLTIRTDDGKDDRPVLAGVHGMIRSVETVPGAALVAGAPLVRLQDCDRAFLTVPPAAKLQAGQTVQVKLPDQKPFAGKVRASAGVMEPPDSLVIGLDPGTVTASCPVGRSATVTPVQS